MAPYRISLRPNNRHRLVSSYLFLITTCVLDHAATPATGNPQQPQQQQQLSAAPPQNSPTSTPQVSNTKPRINVSKLCEPTGIQVTVRTSRPFFGLIHAKDKRRSFGCATEGAGQQVFTMQFEYVAPEEEGYCGLAVQRVPVQQQQQPSKESPERRIMSLILVIRLHKTIESSEDQFFLLSCASTSPSLPLTNSTSYHNKSDCANGRTLNHSTVRDDQIEEAYYKLITSHQIANRWTDSLLSHTPQLELRYQWLVHVSCTLAALLAITLCIALWLCGTRYTRIHNPKKPSRESTSKQILYNSSSQSSNKSTQSTDEHSSSEEILDSTMPALARGPQVNSRQQIATVHSLKRPTSHLHLEHQVDYGEAPGQLLTNTFDPEQAVNYFNTQHRSLANPYQNFRDFCYEPTLEESRPAPVLESTSLMKQQDTTTNSLASDAHMYRLQSKSNPIISQFDPKDSRQLLGLIQQKQLQQIPQQGNIGANQI